MKSICNQQFSKERDLYNQDQLHLFNCRFEGEEDGESALKECRHIELENCYMDLRYPLWHNQFISLKKVEQTPQCRAALWYSEHIEIMDCRINGVKALRECKDIQINDSNISSLEFGWRSKKIIIHQSSIESQYIFMMVEDLKAYDSTFIGKYGFQYMKNVYFNHCTFDTKDAFWHSQNVTVENSTIKGEYLGWYSENLTLINCKIIGIQPLCYCKNLKLVNCTMQDANLAFEYSDVVATIIGSIDSVKNPLSGQICADEIKEIVLTEDSIYPCKAKIKVLNKVSA